MDPARAVITPTPADNSLSLEFLMPAGSAFCQIDTVLQEAIARFTVEEKLLSNKMGISGLQDLYTCRTTIDRHDELKALLLDLDTSGESLRKY